MTEPEHVHVYVPTEDDPGVIECECTARMWANGADMSLPRPDGV